MGNTDTLLNGGKMNLFDGLCPECLLRNISQEMWLNRGDVFECPQCHLLVSLASGLRATILRRRGQGHFKSLQDHYYCATQHAHGLLICRENQTKHYEADGFDEITSEELREYLKEVNGVDENV
jgi:hypothetical protein